MSGSESLQSLDFKFYLNLEYHCPPSYRMIENEILHGFPFIDKVNNMVMALTNPLLVRINDINNLLEQHETRIESLEKELEELRDESS